MHLIIICTAIPWSGTYLVHKIKYQIFTHFNVGFRFVFREFGKFEETNIYEQAIILRKM